MALIVGGVTVTGTQVLDATKLSGTLPAISGENLTSLPASIASSWKNVGSYVLGNWNKSATPDSTYSGSTLYASNTKNQSTTGAGATTSGTWRAMGYTTTSSYSTSTSGTNTTLWLRVS
tara:strand:+ start:139 stop:495 length:357 start_codon:yes stop_codon:yes gene_type:complete